MIRVSINQISPSASGDVPVLLAQFSVDSSGIHAEAGERTDVVASISVIDPESGDRVLSGEDPVRWARLLPLALGSGDLAVNLQEVEAVREEPDPVRALAQEIGDEVPARAEYAF
ncbi:MAG TPA: hypothetical protein VGX72_10110 [Solirubrobacteraceae bacterium]|jgi:hypothetical protein|nr:hypothetical protein [Solirubrobacteraceae bacterium]